MLYDGLNCTSNQSLVPSAVKQIIFLFQVWFQNRRAKFRRNERSLNLQQNSGKLTPKCSPLSNSRIDMTEKSVFPPSSLISAPSATDIQYVMPWKCSHAHYSQQEIYANSSNITSHLNTQNCGFLPGNPYNYYQGNISSSALCSRMDMNAIRYRQEFSLTP